eukprot:TRINITY_DN2434_c0_g1_i4.p1 TRINITY_DN2434_c0_g1~~TRINITY_DN2434_c0_g1_i4.p1  ORF type:complete len:341 (-),score=92.44 TRINITY_DN2434_c0_g1_i4:90-1112(-)
MEWYWWLLIGYVILSMFLTRFPIFYRAKRNDIPIKHGSHRGGAAEKPENTMAAFDHAVRLGTQLLEVDVHLTKDGEVMVMHDAHLGRLCGERTLITECRFAELPRVLAAPRLPPPFHGPDEFLEGHNVREPIPRLEEMFEKYPRTAINIDCKHYSPELMDKVSGLVNKYQRHEITIWGAFKDETCQQLYRRNPTVPLIFSAKQLLYLLLKYFTGLLPYWPIKESYLEIPLFTSRMQAAYYQHISNSPAGSGACARCLLYVLLKIMGYLTSRTWMLHHLQKRGVTVIYWVLNHPEDFHDAFELGADGVMTDYPTRLTRYLAETGDRDFQSIWAKYQGDSKL